MGIAFLPMLFWSAGSLLTARAVRYYGPAATNRWRLLIAIAALGGWVLVGPGLPRHGASWGWLLVSGAVGLGAGDLAMLAGYRAIGPRLTVLMLLCLAVPITGLSEWIWLGTPLGFRSGGLILLLLFGVSVTVWPGGGTPSPRGRILAWGLLYGLLAALGQGLSTTISRVAYHAAAADGLPVNGGVAAWQRMLGGLFFTLVVEVLFHRSAGDPPLARAGEILVESRALSSRGGARAWLFLSSLFGPILGLSAYQWALVTQPGVLVQAISTLTPIAVIPLVWWFDGDRPGWRGIVGGLLASGSAAALVFWR